MSLWIRVERLTAHVLWCALFLLALYAVMVGVWESAWWWIAPLPAAGLAFQVLDALVMTQPVKE